VSGIGIPADARRTAASYDGAIARLPERHPGSDERARSADKEPQWTLPHSTC
jgi:hypothetical protein